ncbi:hypothetical protein [Paenibacillus gorillae]|uniref:hypothetical protein n=1 Tax=Paenibacillus gorillae TaxID=1243662 RepID=UPI0004AF8B2D|nr:hypothetical protein [Paenibacillus gorillae]
MTEKNPFNNDVIKKIYNSLMTTGIPGEDLLHEDLIMKRNGNVLFRCIRFIQKNEQRMLFYHEAWKDEQCYKKRTKIIDGDLCYIGFFFQKEDEVIKNFINLKVFK